MVTWATSYLGEKRWVTQIDYAVDYLDSEINLNNKHVNNQLTDPVVWNNGNAGKPSRNWCLGPSTMAPPAAGVWGHNPRKKLCDCICKVMQSVEFLAGKWFAMPSIMRS